MQHYSGNSSVSGNYNTKAEKMSMRRTKIRSSTAQINAMIRYMTKGAQSSKDQLDLSVDIPELGDEEWECLAENLNNIGPAVKNVSAWKVSWRDLKRSSRMKQVEQVVSTEQVRNFISDGIILEVPESGRPDKHWYHGNKKIRSSKAQITTMVDYMAKNIRFARGHHSSPQERRQQEQEWDRLASVLNAMGPAVKDTATWKVTWRDLTRNTRYPRKKQARIPTAAIAEKIKGIFTPTGGGRPEDEDQTAEDSNDRSSPELSEPASPEGSGPEASPSELDSPEASEGSGTDSSPCPSPTPDADDNGNGKPRCTSEQIKALVECMSINPCMAFGEQDTPEKVDDWKHLRQLLNRLGPPKRTAEWLKYWRMLKKTSVKKSNARAESGFKIPEITKKIVDIVEAHREGHPNELEEDSEEDFDLLTPRVLSPEFNLTLPDLDANIESGTGTQMSPGRRTDQKSPERRNEQISPENINEVSQDISMETGQDLPTQDGSEHDSDLSQWIKAGERKAKKRCTNIQMAALVKYMSANPDLAVPGYFSPLANASRDAKWRQLTKHLNKIGTAKTTDGWKRTWRGLKLTVRSRSRKLTETSMYLYRKVEDILESNRPEAVEELPEITDDMLDNHMPSPLARLTLPDLDEHSNDVTDGLNRDPQKLHYTQEPSRSSQMPTIQSKGRDIGESLKESYTELGLTRNNSGNEVLRCTKAQMNALVNYMSDHPNLAKSKIEHEDFSDTKYAIWRQLTKYLNKMGPAKSTSGWKSTWQCLRSNARKKDQRASLLSRKILGILGEETLSDDDFLNTNQPVKEIVQNAMSTRHLSASSPLPGYCKTRPTNTQIYALVNYISKHPALGSGYTSVESQDPHLTEWRLLARYLNRLGTAKKSTLSWKRTWRDIKSSVVNNRRPSTPWNKKITRKVIEILEAAKTDDGPKDETEQTNDETVNQFDELPCPTEGMPLLYVQSSSHENLEIKLEPDPLNYDQDPSNINETQYPETKTNIEPDWHSENEPPVPVTKPMMIVRVTSERLSTPDNSEISTRKSHVSLDRRCKASPKHSSGQMSPEQSLSSVRSSQGSPEPDNSSVHTYEDQMRDDGNSSEREDERSRQWSKSAKKTRCTNIQLRALTDYMCDHPDMALYNLNSKVAVAEWRNLTRQLNRMGTAAKSTVAWKRTWRDIKKAVRRGKMGGGLDKARERKVRVLLGFETGTESQNMENDTEAPIETPSVTSAAEESPLVSIQRCVEMLTKSAEERWTIQRNKEANELENQAKLDRANETNSLLKELVGELQRSNQLKAEQNIYLRELLKQVSTLTPPKENTDSAETANMTPEMTQKQEMDVTVEGSNGQNNTFCVEDYCVAQLNPASNGVEESQAISTIQEVITRKSRRKKNKTKEEKLLQKRIAERLRYEKLRNDPKKREELKEKERLKYRTRKEKGLVKLVGDRDRVHDEDSLQE